MEKSTFHLMTRDILFLLAAGFISNGRREYCPECAEVSGLISYFPEIRDSLELHYQPIVRPRTDIVQLLGENNQNCPTLVLSDSSPEFEYCGIQTYGRLRFIDNGRDMGLYYSHRFGSPAPRGHKREI